MLSRIAAVCTLIALMAFQAQAQTAGVYVDIGPCMAMESDEERYACYDLLEAQIRAAQTREVSLPTVSIPRNTRQQQAPVNEVVDAVEDSANTVETIDGFGRESVSTTRNREASARVLETEEGDNELVDTVTNLDERIPNQWEITLASGQVWHQINSKRYRLREGMEVRIYPSPFGGSFRLTAANVNGFIQVRRVQ